MGSLGWVANTQMGQFRDNLLGKCILPLFG